MAIQMETSVNGPTNIGMMILQTDQGRGGREERRVKELEQSLKTIQ